MVEVRSKLYTSVTAAGNRIFAWQGWTHKDITSDIDFVKLKSLRKGRQVGCAMGGSGVIAAVLGGLLGYVVTSLLNSEANEAEFTIYFKDGNYIEVTTNKRSLVNALGNLIEEEVRYYVRNTAQLR